MKTFLEYVAQDIIQKFGCDLSRTAVVFPNKRAALFLNDALARLAERPIWSPAYITISDLFRKHSPWQAADPVKLVCDLHRVYCEQTGFDETLDHFYGWGQLLLSDFDDIDKNLAPADRVFANLADIHELDDVSYLTEEQREIIRKFFSNFSDTHNSQLKERFLRLWSRLADIYRCFNERLAEQQLAYEGALYRQVATSDDIVFEYDRYLFVGFNMLQKVEQRLFTTLKNQGKAHFYWDFDQYYIHSEAGHFISQYLDRFPNELNTNAPDVYEQFIQKKKITYVSAPTENIQARYVTTWLRQEPRMADGRKTAVVLCDETLLGAVVHQFPPEVTQVNITTGYPLQQAPVASLVYLLFDLHTLGYDRQRQRYRLRYVADVLRHPYLTAVSERITELLGQLQAEKVYYPTPAQLSVDEGTTLLFGRHADNHAELLHWMMAIVRTIARSPAGQAELASPDAFFKAESLFRMYTLINRLSGLVESGDLTVDTITLQRLLTQIVQSTTIPFHGEPLSGIQVMGVLETRNLDFDHLLLLSTNEGNLPRGVNDSSFIPHSIRQAYGLTTVDHKVAIYAYYFYRLLQRAADITIVYNSTANDGRNGEMSRFMLQMLVESPHQVAQRTLQAGQQLATRGKRPIEKSDAICQTLRRRFDKQLHPAVPNRPETEAPLLTPTAINRYTRCQLQFYYRYVEGLREPDESDDDTIDNRIFGNIFHEAAQLLYERLLQKINYIMPADLETLMRDEAAIERCVDTAFKRQLFHIADNGRTAALPPLNGQQIINRQVILHYLRQLLDIDRRLAPFTIIGLEHDVVEDLYIETAGFTTTWGGRIDRLDVVCGDKAANEAGERTRVIDYKTGATRLKAMPSVEAIFDPSQLHNHNDYYLQAMLYARLVARKSATPVSPGLLFIQHARGDDYDPTLSLASGRINSVNTPDGDRFEQLLVEKVNEIFNRQLAFTPTDDLNTCRTCPYAQLCGMKEPTKS